MAKWIHQNANGLASPSFSGPVTQFYAISGAIYNETTEINAEVLVRSAYNVTDLLVDVTANGFSAAATHTARVNGADDTTLQVTIAANTTGVFEDNTGTIVLASGDTVNTQIVTPSGHGNIQLAIISLIFEDEDGNDGIFCATEQTLFFTRTIVRHMTVVGALHLDLAEPESAAQYLVRTDLTLSDQRVVVASNALDGASTFRVRVNGADVNQSVSITGNTSGAFEDTTNNDVLADGDLLNYEMTAGTSAMANDELQLTIAHMKVNTSHRFIANASHFGRNNTSGLTRFTSMEGDPDDEDTNENQIDMTSRITFDATDYFVRVSENGLDAGSTTFAFRINGADTALALSVLFATTGAFEARETVSVAVADLINHRITTGGSSGLFTWTFTGFELVQHTNPKLQEPSIMRKVEMLPY